MSNLYSRIADDEERYLSLCKKFNEEPIYIYNSTLGGKIVDCYGAHADELEKRN